MDTLYTMQKKRKVERGQVYGATFISSLRWEPCAPYKLNFIVAGYPHDGRDCQLSWSAGDAGATEKPKTGSIYMRFNGKARIKTNRQIEIRASQLILQESTPKRGKK